MLKTRVIFLSFLGLVSLLFFATSTSAGGWPISTWTWDNPDAWKPDYKMTYVRVHLAPDVPCKGTTVTFKYENPQDGDNVSAGGENGSFTFTENGYKVSKYNGNQVPDCNTYAKFYSTNNALKYGLAEFKTETGKVYSAKFALNFQLPNPSNTESEEKYPLPWEKDYALSTSSPLPTVAPQASSNAQKLNVWLLNEQYVSPESRQITIKWSVVYQDQRVRYDVYLRKSGENDWKKIISDEKGPSAILNIKSDEAYYVKVRGCVEKIGNCSESNDFYLPKRPSVKSSSSTQTVVLDKQVITEASDSLRLQKQVDELQKKLEESQKRQSVLEKQLNQIMSWVRSFFPFFK